MPILLLLSLAATVLPVTAAPTPDRQSELRELVRQDCGACHGLTLKGGLGPALTAEALRERDPRALFLTIRDGRPDTPMPPWGRYLKDEEIDWIVQQLLAGKIHAP